MSLLNRLECCSVVILPQTPRKRSKIVGSTASSALSRQRSSPRSAKVHSNGNMTATKSQMLASIANQEKILKDRKITALYSEMVRLSFNFFIHFLYKIIIILHGIYMENASNYEIEEFNICDGLCSCECVSENVQIEHRKSPWSETKGIGSAQYHTACR